MTPSKKVRRYLSLLRRCIENDFVLDAWRCRLKASEGHSNKLSKRCYQHRISYYIERQQLLNKELFNKFKTSIRLKNEVSNMLGLQCMLIRLYSPHAFFNKSGLWTINAIMKGSL